MCVKPATAPVWTIAPASRKSSAAGPGRAVDVRLELLAVELADQVREGLRRAAELGAVVHEEDRDGPSLGGHRPMLALRDPMGDRTYDL